MRRDAVQHDGRWFVPTTDETKWVSSWSEFLNVNKTAGVPCIHFNEDQTEIRLSLPAPYKFAIDFPPHLNAQRVRESAARVTRQFNTTAVGEGFRVQSYLNITTYRRGKRTSTLRFADQKGAVGEIVTWPNHLAPVDHETALREAFRIITDKYGDNAFPTITPPPHRTVHAPSPGGADKSPGIETGPEPGTRR